MIKEWATVVSWQNGQALVSCDVKAFMQQLLHAPVAVAAC